MMRTPAGILFLGFLLKKSNHVCEGERGGERVKGRVGEREGEGGGSEGIVGKRERERGSERRAGYRKRGLGGTLHNLSRPHMQLGETVMLISHAVCWPHSQATPSFMHRE